MSDSTDQPAAGSSRDDDLDVDAERQRLDDLGHRIEDTREHAEADLDVGGAGRTFTDEGVRRQVEAEGDTEHPPADANLLHDDDEDRRTTADD